MDEVLDGCTVQSKHVVDINKAAEKSRVVDMSKSFEEESPVLFSGDGQPFLDEQPMDIAKRIMLLMPLTIEKNESQKIPDKSLLDKNHVSGVTSNAECRMSDIADTTKSSEVAPIKNRHRCSQCNYSTKRKESLKNHINVVHEGGKALVLKCDICGISACSKYKIIDHKLRVHEGIRRFKCAICRDFETFERFKMVLHIKKLHPDKCEESSVDKFIIKIPVPEHLEHLLKGKDIKKESKQSEISDHVHGKESSYTYRECRKEAREQSQSSSHMKLKSEHKKAIYRPNVGEASSFMQKLLSEEAMAILRSSIKK